MNSFLSYIPLINGAVTIKNEKAQMEDWILIARQEWNKGRDAIVSSFVHQEIKELQRESRLPREQANDV
jgi:glycerophosphoryl diester phosphodiesterase